MDKNHQEKNTWSDQKKGNNAGTLENLNIQIEDGRENAKELLYKSSFHTLFLHPSHLCWCSWSSILSPCHLMHTHVSWGQKPSNQLPTRHFRFSIPQQFRLRTGARHRTLLNQMALSFPSFDWRALFIGRPETSLNKSLDHSRIFSLPCFLHVSSLHSGSFISFRAF